MVAANVLVRHLQDSQADSKLRKRKWFSMFVFRWRSASMKQRFVWTCVFAISCVFAHFALRKFRRLLSGSKPPPDQTLDFLVAGFPKCGTTSILFALQKHPDVIMDDKEYCQIARPLQQDDVNKNQLNRYLTDLIKAKQNPTITTQKSQTPKVGIKCPEALKNFKAIHRLSQHSPHSKWVIGLRHPIFFMQSFYNYRVLESHIKPGKDVGEIPNLRDLWETEGLVWRDLSKDSARYDLFLAQLGKTGLNATQLGNFLDHDMLAVKPNRLQIFLYTMDQIDDADVSRKRVFRDSLLRFLGLDPQRLLIDFGHENKNHATGSSGYPETINICATSNADIRASLLEQGTEAARWILDEFLQSPDVRVSNAEHFRESLKLWSADPCHTLDL